MCLIFVGSQLSCFERHQKSFEGVNLDGKSLLNFICHTTKLHNCYHEITHVLDKYFNTVYYRSIFISQSNKDICTSNDSIDYPDSGLVTLPINKSIPL